MEEKTELERFITAGEADANMPSDEPDSSEVFNAPESDEVIDESVEAEIFLGTDDDSEPAFPEDDPADASYEDNLDRGYPEDTEQDNSEAFEQEAHDAVLTQKSQIKDAHYEFAAQDPPQKKRDSRGVFGLGVANIVIASFTLLAISVGFITGGKYIDDMKSEAEEMRKQIEALEAEKSSLQSDYIEAMNIIEESEPEAIPIPEGEEAQSGKILLYDTDIGYMWAPVLSELPLHNYRKSGFSVDGRGRISYEEDGEEASYFGIDVSSYQGDINWQLAKEDGVEFAILRLGFRGYGEDGKLREDEKFLQNYTDAHNAGIDLGVYFFSQAVTPEEAEEEARFLLEILDGRTLEYPVVYDWETVATTEDDTPRTEDVMPQTLTLSAIAFCETIKNAGYDAMVYTNKKQAVMKYDMRQLSEYPVWLAYYDTELNYCYDFDIWQYGTGSVEGIDGEVDLNIAMIK